MISEIHYLELYIDKQLVELESQKSLNIRINSVLFNPTKTSTKKSEYSYSFNIPSTPNNDKILNYANNFAKLNKFHSRYAAQLYADGNLIFDGSLTVKKYDASKKEYNCNLVNIKTNSLEEIFGEDTLPMVQWFVDYEGTSTINAVNADPTTKYWFPLICYGAFEKDPVVTTDDDGDPLDQEYWEYTSKYKIDHTNVFRLLDFNPSLNALEEIKKCFEYKGYTVGGNAFSDPILSNVYASTQFGDGQDVVLNIGNPKFGKCELTITAPYLMQYTSRWQEQELKYPTRFVAYEGDWGEEGKNWKPKRWNFSEIAFYNLLHNAAHIGSEYSNMFHLARTRYDDSYIKIPSDGFYRISMSGTCKLSNDNGNFSAMQWARNLESYGTPSFGYMAYFTPEGHEQNETIVPNIATTTPFEIQLVKNDDDNIELIKGKYNYRYISGIEVEGTAIVQTMDANPYSNPSAFVALPNLMEEISCYPHETLGNLQRSTSVESGKVAFEISDYSKIEDTMMPSSLPKDFYAKLGYVYRDNDVMAYDEKVSDAFICGWTSMGSPSNPRGTTAFKKNGYSWSMTSTEKVNSLYELEGYLARDVWGNNFISEQITEHNQNRLINSPVGQYTICGNTVTASVNGVIELKKDDIVKLYLVERMFRRENGDRAWYNIDVENIHLTIEAVSPKQYGDLIASGFEWNTPTQFPTQLNLMNFTNNDVKISDWLKQMQDAFNLEYDVNGMNVDVNVNKGLRKDITTAVDIDDRVNTEEAISEYIQYPREMAVQYKIDVDEHGFYNSVPHQYRDRSDWKNYGESGYTVIKLSDDTYETQSQKKQTQFSYTWYDNFTYNMNSMNKEFRIPVIEKEEYMIDEINDRDAMVHRGYNLSQRFWFRTFSPLSYEYQGISRPLSAQVIDDSYNRVMFYAPINTLNGFNLSYKDTERSLVTDYFDIYPMLASNYVTIETFLTPQEHIQIKGGALVKFNSDLHYTSEISAYDPSGRNLTKLKLIKKT